ncbi:MAG: hypothetical protein BWX64_02554 [Acidobacteria bacterium ADurb.Bin051]|nr:MAG: hypothetical protein BWX64_02554 [Acidobacteria bacterium ADurb.Bin051]
MPARLRRGPSAVECEPTLDPYTGRELVPLPEALRESVTAAVAEAAREVGEGLAVALAVAEDGEVDELEVARARRELAEIRDRTGRLEAALDRAHLETVRRRQSGRAGNE